MRKKSAARPVVRAARRWVPADVACLASRGAVAFVVDAGGVRLAPSCEDGSIVWRDMGVERVRDPASESKCTRHRGDLRHFRCGCYLYLPQTSGWRARQGPSTVVVVSSLQLVRS